MKAIFQQEVKEKKKEKNMTDIFHVVVGIRPHFILQNFRQDLGREYGSL